MFTKSNLVFFVLLLAANLALARPLLIISDIDDTLKRTHIVGTGLFHYFTIAANALNSKNPFEGMRDLLERTKCPGTTSEEQLQLCLQHDGANKIVYLSASSGVFSGFGANFLKNSGFPRADFIHRGSGSPEKETFKYQKILELAQNNPDSEIILLGDNGEKDVNAYWRAQYDLEQEGRSSTAFLHQVTSHGIHIPDHQIQWITAQEIALELYSRGFISVEDLAAVSSAVGIFILSNEPKVVKKVFPRWLECEDFLMRYKRPAVLLPTELESLVSRVEQRTFDLCRAAP